MRSLNPVSSLCNQHNSEWLAHCSINQSFYIVILSIKVIDTAQLLDTLSRECPKLRYLSLLGNVACPNELLGSGHDDEDYQRYR